MSSLTIKNRIFFSTILYFVCLGISACSGTSKIAQNSGSSNSYSAKGYIQHIHPENECLGIKAHAHAGGEKEHVHNLKCDASVSGPSNAHEHPATGVTGSMRHVHPNGANPHTHH